MGRKRSSAALKRVFAWVGLQSTMVQIFLGVTFVVAVVVALRLLVRKNNLFFVASEAIHFAGILVLIYKLTTQNTCSGLSLKSQELTAIFLAARLCSSLSIEGNIHTFLDFATLSSTVWVIYMIRIKLKSTYVADLDNMSLKNVVMSLKNVLIWSFILSIFIHPFFFGPLAGILWAFAVYLESVSVLPQLRMMQNTKMIEQFTAHYVFALGVARFLGCVHWILWVYDSNEGKLYLMRSGFLWLPAVLLAEIVQTFILADFCYYYVKSVMSGQIIISLPSPV